MDPSDRLDSWKEIAAYLKKGIRTVQRWERTDRLPVHRLGPGTVHAFKPELDTWWTEHSSKLAAAESEEPERRPRHVRTGTKSLLLGGGMAVVAGMLAWGLLRTPTAPEWRALPLTTEHGHEVSPSFSPDGRQIAYISGEPNKSPPKVLIKDVGSASYRRLTKSLEPEATPLWSPDGRSIAFLRLLNRAPVKIGVIVASPDGLSESVAAELNGGGALHTWFADGQKLLATDGEPRSARLVAIRVSDGSRKYLTQKPQSVQGGIFAATSSDSSRLLFARRVQVGRAQIFEQRLTDSLEPVGGPRALTEPFWANDVVWMPNLDEIVYTSGSSEEGVALFRLRLASGSKPVQLLGGGRNHLTPTVSRDGRRLAFAVNRLIRVDIWSRSLVDPNAEPKRLISSTHSDLNMAYSPDGKWVTFHSTRAGASDIWVSDSSGGSLRRLTHTDAVTTATPRWSPDGKRIAFESNQSGQWKVYIVLAAGGAPQLITDHPSMNAFPSWSRDGKMLYFMSDRSGRPEVWRVPVEGDATPVKVTETGGAVACESLDGEYLYYTRSREGGSLMRMPARGGPATEVIPSIRQLFFAVTSKGIYFISANRQISFWNASDGTSRVVFETPESTNIGLAVSPDEQTILFTQLDKADADLYWIDDFK